MIEAEYQLAVKMIEARLKRKMSQRQLAQKVKTSQAAISSRSYEWQSLSVFLKRIATALELKLSIGFA